MLAPMSCDPGSGDAKVASSAQLFGSGDIPSLADPSTLLGLCVALGVGLLVGAERERRKETGPARGAAGIRTFAVCALLGAISVILGGGLLLAGAALMVGAGALVAYQRAPQRDPGMTTEFALLLTCLLGGLAIGDSLLAAGVGASWPCCWPLAIACTTSFAACSGPRS